MKNIVNIQEKRSDKELLSERFSALREKLGVTQREMAIIFGVPLRTWQNWEYAINKPESSALSLLKHYEQNPPSIINPSELCKDLRASLSLKKREMAKMFDCTLNTWGEWERGIRKPHPEVLEKIEKMLHEISLKKIDIA
jgi:DNA-binding transcriptional regulator YiaG